MSELVLENKLSNGWVKTNLEMISDITSGKSAPQGEEFFKNGKYPFVRVADMGKMTTVYLTDTKDHVNELGSKKLKMFPKGSVLFTKSGASTHLNQKFILGVDSYVVSHIGIINPLENISSEFIYYFLKTIDFKSLTHESVMPSLQLSKIKILEFLLPPLNEQKRIVSKIEELFPKIDSAKQSLEHTKLKLELYRNSLLESAFEGKLKNKKIKFEVNNWSKVSYCDVSNRITYGFTCPMPDSDEGPWKITALNIRNGKINYENARKTDWESFNTLLTDKSRPKVGTVVIIKDGATIGRVGIIDRENVCISQSVASIEPNNKIISEFLAYSLHRPKSKILIEKNKRATGIPHISITDLAKWEILLPSLKEQEQIVSQIEQGFSLIENTSQIVNSTLQKLQTMKMSILKQAFEGKLVLQDPNDEPASVLLEKIKHEKEQLIQKQKASKVKKNVK